MRVATFNAGSGTIKLALAEVGGGETRVEARHLYELTPGVDPVAAFESALEAVGARLGVVEAVGHRVVHGGTDLVTPVRVEPAVEETIAGVSRFAPLHNPLALTGIRVARKLLPKVPQVAVFDTGFHSARAAESWRYALPWESCESLDLFRYGFHGIAHASLVESLATAEGVAPEEVTGVTLQLGAGCSACAVAQGRSVETSMGFSPLGGLPMAARSGDLDPMVVLELIRELGDLDEVERMLARRSGLLGMTGFADMRTVLQRESDGDPRAGIGLALFVRNVVMTTGAYFTLLGGEGALVFGGGIGTHSAEIRHRVSVGLAAWNVELDGARNQAGRPGRISQEGSRPVYVFETDEERIIAHSTWVALRAGDA